MSLSSQEIDEIADAVAIRQVRYNSPVLTSREAMRYVGKTSEKSFREWRSKWSVSMCSDGRYSRRALDAGLNKESRRTHKRTKPVKASA